MSVLAKQIQQSLMVNCVIFGDMEEDTAFPSKPEYTSLTLSLINIYTSIVVNLMVQI